MFSHWLIFLNSSAWSQNTKQATKSVSMNENKTIRAPQYQYAKGTVLHLTVVCHHASLATKEYQEHSDDIYYTYTPKG